MTLTARTPKWVRKHAVRALEHVARLRYTFVGDGIATIHHCGFLDDPAFRAVWPVIAAHWQPGLDVRWRVWILRQIAQQCAPISGAYAEFGTFRGGCAGVILSAGVLEPERPLYLFDTYTGIPPEDLLDVERWFVGRYTETSPDLVRIFLQQWDRDNVRLVVGNVLETLPVTETGPLAFVHLDLNGAAATRRCLTYAYDRLTPGGIVLFDDYGWPGYEAQRQVIEEFSAAAANALITLPTGQAIMVRV